MSVQLMAGILQGFQASQDRMTNIAAARDKKRQDDETFKTTQKMNNLKIDQLEMTGELDRVAAENARKQLKLNSKILDAQSEMADDVIKNAFSKEKDTQGKLTQAAGSLAAFSLMKQNQDVWGYKGMGQGFGNVSVPKAKAASTAVTAADKVMGAIDVGSIVQDGEEVPFKDQKDVEKYATRNLGYNWKTKHPEVMDLINEKFSLPDASELDLTTGIRAGVKAGRIGGDKVLVEFNGKQGKIPKTNLEEAIRRGARVIQ